MKKENVVRVMADRTPIVKFFPSNDETVVVAGNNLGNVAFWGADLKDKESGIYLYNPHSGHILGIEVQPYSLSKIYSTSYDGFICVMDIEKELFNVLYSCDKFIHSLSLRPYEAESLYFGDGDGFLNVWDERAGKCFSPVMLHDKKISTMDFNPVNTNMMVTSTTDQSACIWDLRKINSQKTGST
ncbi:hypothetical protein GIB67_016759 [Kingdonia uniflora]|uniref:Uncharacterized protein n=1 Tax=Kingdonia uniflora TaxID=39325 RepID=A0A7J7LXV0_9MAGN|nr:hypothetical protein GIB67_016759 [Kingdonia uniflora]